MESSLSVPLKQSFHLHKPPLSNPPKFNLIKSNFKQPTIKITTTTTKHLPIINALKSTARAIVFAAATAAVISKFQHYPAIAQPITPTESEEEETQIPEFIESDSEEITAMKALLEKKLEAGEDEESLKILKTLVSAHPENLDLKFLMARLLNEKGEIKHAREVFDEMLTQSPLKPLFENSSEVIKTLEKALEIAVEEKNLKQARDVRLIIAQVQFLQKNVDEALSTYDDLVKEDPNDFRPYFCKGLIYSLIDKDDEAEVQFAKYRELSPKKFVVEEYLQTPLSSMKLFGSDEQN